MAKHHDGARDAAGAAAPARAAPAAAGRRTTATGTDRRRAAAPTTTTNGTTAADRLRPCRRRTTPRPATSSAVAAPGLPPPSAGFLFNHDDVATEKTCAECKEYFCPNCVVELQGKTLCGPCKNFQVRGLHRPGKIPPLAVVAVIVGMVSSPVTFCLTLFGSGQMGGVGAVILSIVGLAIPVGGLVVSSMALRQIESRPNAGGRGLAMTGATSSLVGALWCLTVAFLVILRLAQG